MVGLVLGVCLIFLVLFWVVAVRMSDKRRGMLQELQTAVERLHNCSVSFAEDVVIVEKSCNQTACSGVVLVYELNGHPQVTKASDALAVPEARRTRTSEA